MPLVGFFLALVAFWCWSQARELGINADLQKRLWHHSKYHRDYGEQTPLDVSEAMAQRKVRFTWLALALALLALVCFGWTLTHLNQIAT